MADTKLPVKIRMGIRDSWDAPKCPLRTTINALSDLLGTTVDIIVDWGLLWNVLSPQYPDPNTFIPSVEEATRVWAESLQERLDNSEFEEWTDQFLEKVKVGSGIKLEIGVSEDGLDRPETTWDDSQAKLSLLLPRGKGQVYLNALQAGYASDFEHLFNKKSAPSQTTTLPVAAKQVVEEDGWSVVPQTGAAHAPPAPAPVAMAPQAQAAQPERLPSLATLGRPEILFETSTPYLIYVRKFGNKELHIESSHQGSLNLICDYFQKWVRKDRNYNGNVIEISKQASLFGLNAGFDYVKIECNRWELLNPTPFLAFIEIVLKYQLVEAASGMTWFYRRDVKFI
ncbi:hypothetical protein ABW19_dt0208638 [Dactylella cylindrospora]|nr:hypothetical protein ABW19_dt0208638 [Dactylella cylindrospora]